MSPKGIDGECGAGGGMCYVDRVLRHGCGRGAGCLGCVLRRVTAFLLAGVGEGRG